MRPDGSEVRTSNCEFLIANLEILGSSSKSGGGKMVRALTKDIGTLVTRTPDVRGGRPRIAGTGVTVQRMVGWYKLGLTPQEMADEFGHLTLAQIYAALAYYHANRDEIEAAIAAEEETAVRAERQHYEGRTRVFPTRGRNCVLQDGWRSDRAADGKGEIM